MKRITQHCNSIRIYKFHLFFFLFFLNCTLFGQTDDLSISLKNETRIEKLERENIELKAKIDAYNSNNSNILNTVYFVFSIILGVWGLVNIGQLIQNKHFNEKRIKDIKLELINHFSKELELKVASNVSSKLHEISDIKNKLNTQELELIKLKCPTLNRHNLDLEIITLVDLLNKTLVYYKDSYNLESKVEIILNGILNHIEIHSVPKHDKQYIFNACSNEKITSKFGFQVSQIKELLNKKE